MSKRFLLPVVLFSLAQLDPSAVADAGVPTTTTAATTQATVSKDEAKARISGAIAPLVGAALEAAQAHGAGGTLLRVGPNRQPAAERYPLRAAIAAAEIRRAHV